MVIFTNIYIYKHSTHSLSPDISLSLEPSVLQPSHQTLPPLLRRLLLPLLRFRRPRRGGAGHLTISIIITPFSLPHFSFSRFFAPFPHFPPSPFSMFPASSGVDGEEGELRPPLSRFAFLVLRVLQCS